ncbi:MAG TPA: hypothetical protein VHW45_20275 [Candidatus Sulfotelmatobacter sp.]|jgi:hypothetical protein|nr:hypothetical protein [Candidatus Sulfotelmatobacter sp.]
MPNDDLEVFQFAACRDLYGNIQDVSVGRRNGRPAIFFSRSAAESLTPPDFGADPQGPARIRKSFSKANNV